MSARTSPPILVARVGRDSFRAGVAIAVAAKRATGFPSDVDEDTLRRALAARQAAALGVWLAYAGSTPVGHALIARVGDDHDTWGRVTDPVIVEVRAAGRLAELGGLSVHPDHHRLGIARRLQSARLDYCRTHGLVPVAAAWNSSDGSFRLCSQAGRPVASHHAHPITLFHLDDPDTGATR
jgi:GNAT superfamily N-acetyltransferase